MLRRTFLTGCSLAAAAAFARTTSAPTSAPTNLRGGEVLPDPDFGKLRDTTPFLIGVRPYRTGGVRLELDPAPLPSSSSSSSKDAKRIVHNYGHGGAGVTLSWGSAAVVVEHVAALRADPAFAARMDVAGIAVLGSGVVGLTTASELKRRFPTLPVRVYAQSLDLATTTSWVAGGQFEPSGMHRLYTGARRAVLHDLVRRSRDRVAALQALPNRAAYGVAMRKNYTLDGDVPGFDDGMPRDVVASPRKGRLPFARLTAPGREYQTWLMTPAILLPKLKQELTAGGVGFVERRFASVADVASLDESVVVNCTGYGARALWGDATVIPQRGHNVVLQKTSERQHYFFSGGCDNDVIAYVFCRQNDIVVGGTIQPQRDDIVLGADDDAIFRRLLANAAGLFAGDVAGCVRT